MRLVESALRLFVVLAWLGVWPYTHAAEDDDYQLQLNIERQDRQLHTRASFRIPLTGCEAYRYLTDYDAAKKVTGVVDSKTTRLGGLKVRVERWAQERILLFTIKLHSIVDYLELPFSGTDFQQLQGDAKVFNGQWRLEPDGDGTRFRFDGLMEPDSAFPMAVVQHFIQHRMRDRFLEMAVNGAKRKGLPVQACD